MCQVFFPLIYPDCIDIKLIFPDRKENISDPSPQGSAFELCRLYGGDPWLQINSIAELAAAGTVIHATHCWLKV
jgi:hypothetical protein